MTRTAGRLIGLTLVVSLAFALIGCGGGGASGGGSGSFAYSGQTTKAVVQTSNAENIGVGTYQGGLVGSSLGGVASLNTANSAPIAPSRYMGLSILLNDMVSTRLQDAPVTGSPAGKAVQTTTDIIDGDCGGYASATLNYNDITGDLSGSFSFNSYCLAGTTISGDVTFGGKHDFTTGVVSLMMSFTSLTAVSAGDSFTSSGTILTSTSFSPADLYLTINMMIKDNNTGEVVHVSNMDLRLSHWSSAITVKVFNGRIYLEDYGYVDCWSHSIFYFQYGGSWPYRGSMMCTGEVGSSGGNTMVVFNASGSYYYVTADTTGDGNYDYNSGYLPWSSL